MVAHGVGMGIYNTDGIMQIINDENIWRAIGYKVIQGQFKKDSHIIIDRPPENSISLVHESYSGNQDCLIINKFNTIEEEISWISSSIKKDIYTEEVEPHHIIVVSLKMDSPKDEFIQLQSELHKNGVPSIIPGADGIDRDKFGETGFVTLSSVFKAKGNEAFIIYVMNFDYLYTYIDFVNSRNKAFTSITRTKGWCRITGSGKRMERAVQEISAILKNYPKFDFIYPDPKNIARLLSQEEHARRLAESKKVRSAFSDLISSDHEAIKDMSKDEINKLIEILKNADK